MNEYYPLSRKDLKSRFAPLFSIIKSHQSGSFIGLPNSAKSGYFKFLMEENKLIHSMLPEYPKDVKIIYFEIIPLKVDTRYYWLYQLSVKIESIDNSYIHHPEEDPVQIISRIQKYILSLAKRKKHLVIILHRPKFWSSMDEDSGYIFKSFWDICRSAPDNVCSLIFLLYSQSAEGYLKYDFYKVLKLALCENQTFFPVLNSNETRYTIKRFCSMYKLKYTSSFINKLYELSGGYYPLISNSIKVLKNISPNLNSNTLSYISNNPDILGDISAFWESLPVISQQQLKKIVFNNNFSEDKISVLKKLGLINNKNEIVSAWIKNYIRDERFRLHTKVQKNKELFKGKEYSIYNLLFSHKDEVVTRSDIADLLWGEAVKEKYSEWAIDKIMSRIRKKLIDTNAPIKIITLKDQGYMLVE